MESDGWGMEFGLRFWMSFGVCWGWKGHLECQEDVGGHGSTWVGEEVSHPCATVVERRERIKGCIELVPMSLNGISAQV